MCPCLWSQLHANAAEVGSGVGRHQRVTDPTDHPRQSDERLRVLAVREVLVALQNGCLNVATSRVKDTHTVTHRTLFDSSMLHGLLYNTYTGLQDCYTQDTTLG